MKTYQETIEKLAEIVYARYMNGSDELFQGLNLVIVAFIYGRTSHNVYEDVQTAFNGMKNPNECPWSTRWSDLCGYAGETIEVKLHYDQDPDKIYKAVMVEADDCEPDEGIIRLGVTIDGEFKDMLHFDCSAFRRLSKVKA